MAGQALGAAEGQLGVRFLPEPSSARWIVIAVGRQALFRFGHGQARRERGQKKEDDGESAENSHDAGQGKMLPV